MKRILPVVVALFAWWLASIPRFADRQLVVSPAAAGAALPTALHAIAHDLVATTVRALSGLVIGGVIGLVLGGSAALVRKRARFDAMFDFARSIPPVVLLPAFLLAFGWNDSAKIATVAGGTVWIVALLVTSAASEPRSARSELLEVAGTSRIRALLWTQPWESLGVLVVALRTSASMAVIVAVVTEMVAGADAGIGTRVIAAQIAGDTVGFTHALLAIGVLGWAMNLGFVALERRVRRVSSGRPRDEERSPPDRSRRSSTRWVRSTEGQKPSG